MKPDLLGRQANSKCIVADWKSGSRLRAGSSFTRFSYLIIIRTLRQSFCKPGYVNQNKTSKNLEIIDRDAVLFELGMSAVSIASLSLKTSVQMAWV